MELKHWVVMAPMTRVRNTDDFVPTSIMKDYYRQRASVPGTLIISEAVVISRRGLGVFHVPGIWTDEQIRAWKEITDAVHGQRSFIILQLWAHGRPATPALMEKQNVEVVSSSAVRLSDEHAIPRALTVEEIQDFVSDYAQAARNAITAGFDGVELHGANGCLVDQFTQSTCNQRTDLYGGSIENRSRFALEATRALVEAVGADKVGIRLSPWSDFYGMGMGDPVPQFTHLIDGLKELKLAYLHLVESRVSGASDRDDATESLRVFIERWAADNSGSPVLAAGGFKGDDATKHYIDEEYADTSIAIVIGRPFTSNPDLPFRIKHGIDLTPYDRSTFYTQTPEGYADFAFSPEFEEANRQSLDNSVTSHM